MPNKLTTDILTSAAKIVGTALFIVFCTAMIVVFYFMHTGFVIVYTWKAFNGWGGWQEGWGLSIPYGYPFLNHWIDISSLDALNSCTPP